METTRLESAVQIINLHGRAFTIDTNGIPQAVTVGQVLARGAVLLTDANTQIVYADVSAEPLAGTTAHTSVNAAMHSTSSKAVTPSDIKAMQAAILAGEDPSAVFAAPAAGNLLPSGVFNGSSGNAGFVVVDRVGDSLLAEAGFDTGFADGLTPIINEEVSPLIAPMADEGDVPNSLPDIIIEVNPPLTPSGRIPEMTNNSAFVDESALANGSDANSDNETATGRFILNTGQDGLAGLALQQADGTWLDVTQGGQVTGLYGTVTVTLVDGQYQWRYDLSGALDHPDHRATGIDDLLAESFVVRVTDTDGDQARGQLTISILDDGPLARDDSAAVAEDSSVTINVFSNDIAGADGVNLVTGVVLLSAPAKGHLVYNADGTFTYTANAGEEGLDSFVYQLTDGDGDTSSATVTITIGPDSIPVISVPPFGDGEGLVWESALLNGSGGGTRTTSGQFSVDTGNDILSTLEVKGANGWETITSNGQVVSGLYGDMAVNLDGSWQYILQRNSLAHDDNSLTDGDGDRGMADQVSDPFAIRATDSDGSVSAEAILTITVNDDGPTAIADINLVQAGDMATDNLLLNDVFGADGAAVGGAITHGLVGVKVGAEISLPATGGLGGALIGTYGTLILNANGSYSYASQPNQTLPPGASDVFTYTIQDGDGDLSTTTLTITLIASDPGGEPDPELVITPTPALVVYEKALDLLQNGSDLAPGTVIGSAPSDPSETATGQLLTTGGVGGLTYALVGSVQGTYGQIQLNSDGSYIYTLTSPVTSSGGNDGANLELAKENFSYQVTDANGNSQTGIISIDIVDDVPLAVADTATLQAGPSVSGNVLVNDEFGADGAAVGGGVVGVHAGIDLTTPPADSVGSLITGQFGTLLLNADGGYIYSRTAGDTQAADVTDVFSYLIQDGDGDVSTTTLTIRLPGSGEPNVPEDGVLVVGSNANDNPAQTTPHTVPGTGKPNQGDIQGGTGNDVLVGDTGLSQGQAGQTANLILVLDSSGSMLDSIQFDGSSISRMAALQEATLSLVDSLTDSGAENVRINLIDFDNSAQSLGVFDLVTNGVINTAGVMAAKAAIDSMTAGGGTNYEDGLQTALQWIQTPGATTPYTNADLNQVLFISDGAPNAWNNASGAVAGGHISALDTTKALGEVLGTDGSNEVEQIFSAGWTIEAIGIGLSDAPVLMSATKLESIAVGQNNKGYVIEDANGLNLALVSAWQASGELINSTIKGANTGVPSGFVGASTQTGGIPSSGLSQGQMLRFDFSGATDYDGPGVYNHHNFTGPLAGAASFDFSGFNTNTDVGYRVFYMDGTVSNLVSTNSQSPVNITAPVGKIIDYIEFKVLSSTGTGYIKLASITALSALAILDQIEGGHGQAVNVENAEQLSDAVGELGGGQSLQPAGNDTIIGGDGDDIMFGDVLFTDTLAIAAGVNTAPGDGWRVFTQLEAGLGQGNFSSWDRSDTLAYIKDTAHHGELAQESGRLGGNDILLGGAGDDIIFGQEGHDVINGGTGNNMLSGGSGNDTFQFTDADAGSINTIIDFGMGKDVLDLQALLVGENSANISQYLNFSVNGNDTLLAVSPTGDGNNGQVILLQGVDLLALHGAGDSASLINAMLIDQTLMIDL